METHHGWPMSLARIAVAGRKSAMKNDAANMLVSLWYVLSRWPMASSAMVTAMARSTVSQYLRLFSLSLGIVGVGGAGFRLGGAGLGGAGLGDEVGACVSGSTEMARCQSSAVGLLVEGPAVVVGVLCGGGEDMCWGESFCKVKLGAACPMLGEFSVLPFLGYWPAGWIWLVLLGADWPQMNSEAMIMSAMMVATAAIAERIRRPQDGLLAVWETNPSQKNMKMLAIGRTAAKQAHHG